MRLRAALTATAAAAVLASCGGVVAGGASAGQAADASSVASRAERDVRAAVAPGAGRVPGATGDCDRDTAALADTMAGHAEDDLTVPEQLAVGRLRAVVDACGGQVPDDVVRAFDS